MPTLSELASQIRSKNAGPLRLTIDVFFDSDEPYERVRCANVLTPERIAEAYAIPESAVIGIYELDRINAIKISLERPTPAGSLADTDMYGAQQHGPIVDIEVP